MWTTWGTWLTDRLLSFLPLLTQDFTLCSTFSIFKYRAARPWAFSTVTKKHMRRFKFGHPSYLSVHCISASPYSVCALLNWHPSHRVVSSPAHSREKQTRWCISVFVCAIVIELLRLEPMGGWCRLVTLVWFDSICIETEATWRGHFCKEASLTRPIDSEDVWWVYLGLHCVRF